MFDSNFDKQKLAFHPGEVNRWLETGKTRGPIYTEMELCSACNCRCNFCGVDYLVNKTHVFVEPDLARKVLQGLHEIGNRAVMFCGHGEPLLHPQAEEIISDAGQMMSTSVTTNGLALTEDRLGLIDRLEWIRFSINGCSPANYGEIHGVSPEMFDRVLSHVDGCVRRKRSLGLDVVIGTQLVLLPENASGVMDLARQIKQIGADYFSVKPFSQHPLAEVRREIDYSVYAALGEELASLKDDRFKTIYRSGSIAKAGAEKPYCTCYGTHFLSFVSANGAVWECNVFAGDERFLIGSVTEQTMSDIWNGPRRQETLRFIENEMNVGDCRDICRMDECNRYLWRLKHPWPHDNFI